MRSLVALGPVLLLLALAGGCSVRPAASGAEPDGLLASLQASAFGDSVSFVLQVTNTTGAPVELEYRSGQRFDFVVERDGAEVWRWSDGQMFTQALGRESLPPGETLTFSATWTPPPGTAGEFTARGILTAANRGVEQQARFRIP